MPLFKCFGQSSPLRFHANHGESIRLSSDRAVATRMPSQTNERTEAVVYSDRPIRPNEKVHIRVQQNYVDHKTSVWYGFTNVDPGDGRLNTCGTLRVLNNESSKKDICFSIDSVCGIESIRGEKKPRWAMLLVRGIGSTVQFVENDVPKNTRNPISNPLKEQTMSDRPLTGGSDQTTHYNPPSGGSDQCAGTVPLFSDFEKKDGLGGSRSDRPAATASSASFLFFAASPAPAPAPAPRALASIVPTAPPADLLDNIAPLTSVAGGSGDEEWSPLRFHANHGESIRLSSDRAVATRMPSQTNERTEAVVYSDRPVWPNEKVHIRVHQKSVDGKTTVSYGFTRVDPGKGRVNTCVTLRVLDNKSSKKDICFSIDSFAPISYVCSNKSQEKRSLWAIFLISGIGSTVQFVDTKAPEHIREIHPAQEAAMVRAAGSLPLTLESQPRLQQSRVEPVEVEPPVRDEEQPSSGDPPPCSTSGECSVCLDRAVDSALCPCGHMCACHACALQLCRDGGQRCPICRAHIEKVMRIFKC